MRLRSYSPARATFNLSSHARRAWLPSAVALFLATSCSLAYDLSPDQCGKSSECRRFGEFFECVEGICVDRNPMVNGGSDPGGKGGTGNAGKTGNTGGSGNEGGDGDGEGAGEGGSTGGADNTPSGGTGGTEPEPECQVHKDCFLKYGEEEPWACVQGTCQGLLTEECPRYLPLDDEQIYDLLLSSNAVVIGAFANPNTETNELQINGQIQNIDLALSQIALETGGIPGTGGSRQIVTVVCKAPAQQSELAAPMDHLVGDLKVPALIATLETRDQEYVFNNWARDADVFMMVPWESDDNTVNLDDDGLVYHMLAGPDDLSVTYQPLIDVTIEHLENKSAKAALPYTETRIALVTARDNRFLSDLGNDFIKNVRWDGESGAKHLENQDGKLVSVETRTLDDSFNQGPLIDAILTQAPHIIVGATWDEMTTKIMIPIEQQWDSVQERKDQGRPFYILSPFNYNSARNALLTASPSVRQRLLGINWPATPGTQAYNDYKTAYVTRWQGGMNFDHENFYDAVYFLAYGMVAAGPQLRGATIATGMTRLTGGRTQYNVGTEDLGEAFSFLRAKNTNTIDLTGANGRPEWNAGGGRQTPASVWCLNSQNNFVPDVLTYDKESDPPSLTGTVPAACFTFPEPPPEGSNPEATP